MRHDSTTVWHRGRPRTFKDEKQAEDWLKEIKMAKEEKREPKGSSEPVAVVEPVEIVYEVTVPDSCTDCDITAAESFHGGVFVSHPGRMGVVTGTFASADSEEVTDWLGKIHVEESQ